MLNTEGLRDFGGQVIDDILFSKISGKARIHVSEIANQEQRIKYQSEMTEKIIELRKNPGTGMRMKKRILMII